MIVGRDTGRLWASRAQAAVRHRLPVAVVVVTAAMVILTVELVGQRKAAGRSLRSAGRLRGSRGLPGLPWAGVAVMMGVDYAAVRVGVPVRRGRCPDDGQQRQQNCRRDRA